MTTRQDKRPAANRTTGDQNQWFEALALATIERTPTSAWENAVALWRRLPLVWPSTRDRILRRMLDEAARRGDPWPAKLVERFAEAAIPAFADAKARGRVHDVEGMKRAARYVAHHPSASWGEIAKAAGANRETVRQWVDRADFKKHRDDEELQIKLADARTRRWAEPVDYSK
jgi:hypothetical protein